MPGMVNNLGRTTQSTYSRTAIGLIFSGLAGNATSKISPIIEVMGASCGVTPAGSCSLTKLRRSVICWRLPCTFEPQANSMYTIDKPTPETERTRPTPGMPVILDSIGNVTNCSTSSGAMPPASVIKVTVGLFKSGNTSTGIWRTVKPP